MSVQRLLHLIDHIEVLHIVNLGSIVIHGKRPTHVGGVIHKVDNENFILARCHPVEPGECLDNLHVIGNLFVNVHGHQLWLVKPGLELVGHEHDPVLRALERNPKVLTGHIGVHADFCEFLAFVHHEYLLRITHIVPMDHLFTGHLS